MNAMETNWTNIIHILTCVGVLIEYSDGNLNAGRLSTTVNCIVLRNIPMRDYNNERNIRNRLEGRTNGTYRLSTESVMTLIFPRVPLSGCWSRPTVAQVEFNR
jgi:hypothetical protein